MTFHTKSHAPRQDEGRYNQSDLTAGKFARVIHRDYLAHTARWSWAAQRVNPGDKVLDVGCGAEVPFARVLGNFSQGPPVYTGVDANPIKKKPGNFWVTIKDEFDYVERHPELGRAEYDIVVCFEVIEHMSVEDGARLLEGLRYNVADEGVVFLSTPVYNGSAAANHRHEYTIPELNNAVQEAGFWVEARFGTFANVPALKAVMSAEHREVWDDLSQYYNYDVLSTMFAPLYPDAARNNLWVLAPDA